MFGDTLSKGPVFQRPCGKQAIELDAMRGEGIPSLVHSSVHTPKRHALGDLTKSVKLMHVI